MSRRPAWWLNVLKVLWPISYWSARMTQWPIIGKGVAFIASPFFKDNGFHLTYIPINQPIKGVENAVLPRMIIEELIKRSSHRVTINRCSCRDSAGCKTYPIQDSCLLMGDGTTHIDPRISKHISIDEALKHLDNMLSLGLIPMAGRVRMDDLFYGVPNEQKLLTVCFCCRCCCTVLKSLQYYPQDIQSKVVRLNGLSLSVDPEKCKKCGTCVEDCFMKALTLSDKGGIVRNEQLCKGCGRCATVCPEKAVSMCISDMEAAIADVQNRIRQRINYE